jgi:hypothetical protein
MTTPGYDPLQDAIINERRQRQTDQNIYRMQRDAAPQPILPPNNNPASGSTFGRICPAWGC